MAAALDESGAGGDGLVGVAAITPNTLLASTVGGEVPGVAVANPRLGVAPTTPGAKQVFLGAFHAQLAIHLLTVVRKYEVGWRVSVSARVDAQQVRQVTQLTQERDLDGVGVAAARTCRRDATLVSHRRHLHAGQSVQTCLHRLRLVVVVDRLRGEPTEGQREVARQVRWILQALEVLALIVLVGGQRVVARRAVAEAAIKACIAGVALAAVDLGSIPVVGVREHRQCVALGPCAGMVTHVHTGTVAAAVIDAAHALAGKAFEPFVALAEAGVGIARASVAALGTCVCSVISRRQVCPRLAERAAFCATKGKQSAQGMAIRKAGVTRPRTHGAVAALPARVAGALADRKAVPVAAAHVGAMGSS